jgi:hypothetical protein
MNSGFSECMEQPAVEAENQYCELYVCQSICIRISSLADWTYVSPILPFLSKFYSWHLILVLIMGWDIAIIVVTKYDRFDFWQRQKSPPPPNYIQNSSGAHPGV